jgi:ribokinase
MVAKVFYFSSLLEQSFKAQLKVFAFAKKYGVKVAWNPSCYQSEMGKKLWPYLKNVHYLILNKEEAGFLMQKEKAEPKELLDDLYQKLSPEERVVIITDGSKGAYMYDGSDFLKLKPSGVKVVESTGAGDAFASAFVASVLHGLSYEKAFKVGSANAESVIQKRGAKENILTFAQAQKKTTQTKVMPL